MRLKETSDALKRHRKTLYLARHNPERWAEERIITLSESLHDAQEKKSKVEKKVEASGKLLEHKQQQVSLVKTYEEELWAYGNERLIALRRNWQLQRRHEEVNARSTRRSLMS